MAGSSQRWGTLVGVVMGNELLEERCPRRGASGPSSDAMRSRTSAPPSTNRIAEAFNVSFNNLLAKTSTFVRAISSDEPTNHNW